jgi:uncharacterized protein YhdP
VEVPVRNVSYQIAPDETGPNGASGQKAGTAWPEFTDIEGTVLFERAACRSWRSARAWRVSRA